MKRFFTVLAVLTLLAACKGEVPNLQRWVGKWNGPEGTFLIVSKNDKAFEINIQSLDGLASYQGKAVKDGISFKRGDKTETIRAGNGKDTGMKWLLDKKDCLFIQTGEGFCRD